MHPLKRLASQTAIYGTSSVLGRFLNYLLVPFLTYHFAPAEYGVIAEFYAYMGFLGVLLTFGLETGYFRFRTKQEYLPETVYTTALTFLILVNGIFFITVYWFQEPLAQLLRHPNHPEYLWWSAAILGLDSIGALAFARLRAEEQARKFALLKLIEIGVNIGLTVLFIAVIQDQYLKNFHSFLGQLWNPKIGIGYVFLANLAASIFKLLLLSPQLWNQLNIFSLDLCKKILNYSLPLVIIGFAGIINEMLDRAALKYLLPFDPETNLYQLGIYSACYKLSILMTLFIQAFRYAGEPFFFNYSQTTNARNTYALVLTWFVICCVWLFLLVTLNLDIFQYFVGKAYRAGLGVVPILLLASLLLGIYINLSIWYKLTDRTLLGAIVSLIGAGITVGLLFWWVPIYGYIGAAWAHLICYTFMVILSYLLGKNYYPVPYKIGRVLSYISLGIVLYLIAQYWRLFINADHPRIIGAIGLIIFSLIVMRLDGLALLNKQPKIKVQ